MSTAKDERRPLVGVAPVTARAKSTLIEPVLLMFCLAKGFSDSVVTDLVERGECRARGGGGGGCAESAVQPAAAQLLMGRALLEALGPAVVALFVGPWSDRHGRKPFLLLATIGASVSCLCFAALSREGGLGLPPAALLLASLPLAATGGSTVVFMLALCYVTDVTDADPRSRPIRMSTVALCVVGSGGLSGLAAPACLRLLDGAFPPVFLASAALLAATALYAHLRLRETVSPHPAPTPAPALARSLSAACLARRVDVVLLVAAAFVQAIITDGESKVTYLATRQLFGWQLTDFALYSCVASAAFGLGAVVGGRLCGGSPARWSALASLVLVGRCWLLAAARRSPLAATHLYAAALLSAAAAPAAPLLRAHLASLLPPHHLGDVFGAVAFLDSVCPVASSPLYTQLYRASLAAADPAAFFALSAALALALTALLTAVAIMETAQRKNYLAFATEAVNKKLQF